MQPERQPSSHKRKHSAIPRFALYRDADSSAPELLHIEEVQSRSRLYHWEIDTHVHQGLHQILWLNEGQVQANLDEWNFELTGPGAIIIPPGVVHGFRFKPDIDGLVLTLSPRFFSETDVGIPAFTTAVQMLFAEVTVLTIPREEKGVARLQALFHELNTEFLLSGTLQSPLPLWLARAVIWRLAVACEQYRHRPHTHDEVDPNRSTTDGTNRAYRHHALFTRFLLLIEQHFLEHWTLTQYADRLGLSVQRLNRLVRAESGKPALEWIHERLTREACRRLRYIAAPASSLALELGFDDSAYFSRFFKRRTGFSPHQWRLAQQESLISDNKKASSAL